MMKKVITGALVLLIFSTVQTTASHAAYQLFPIYKYSRNVNQPLVEIIRPKGDIIVQDSLLISVQVLDNASVTLSIYKKDTEKKKDVLIFGPEKVDQGENLKYYTKHLKDLSPGKYKMVFDIKDKNGNEKDPVVKEFTVKVQEPEMNKSLDSIPKMNAKNILDNILDGVE